MLMDCKEIIEEAVRVLRQGGVILYPTDTVWGLGCDATSEQAVERIFRIKKRSSAKSLVLLTCDMDMVARYVKEIPDIAIDLVEVNDAPMTIIYPGAQFLSPAVCAEDGSVGIRIPYGNPICKEMVYRFRKPVVSTSANISGEPAPLLFSDISEEIKSAVDYIIPKSFDTESTGKPSQIIKLGLRGEVEIIR